MHLDADVEIVATADGLEMPDLADLLADDLVERAVDGAAVRWPAWRMAGSSVPA